MQFASAQAGAEIRLAGDPEARSRKQRLPEGVPLPDNTWAAIVETARAVGLDERRIQLALSPSQVHTSRRPGFSRQLAAA